MNEVFTQSGECEESKTDFSLRSKQGFLAEPVLSETEGLEMTRDINQLTRPFAAWNRKDQCAR